MQCHGTTLLALWVNLSPYCSFVLCSFSPAPLVVFLVAIKKCEIPRRTTRWITGQDRIVSKKLIYSGWPRGYCQALPLQARVNLGAIAIKGCSAFLKAPALIEPHHVWYHIQDTHWGSLTEMQLVYFATPANRANMSGGGDRPLGNDNVHRWITNSSMNWFTINMINNSGLVPN